jgi:hypothetical protein
VNSDIRILPRLQASAVYLVYNRYLYNFVDNISCTFVCTHLNPIRTSLVADFSIQLASGRLKGAMAYIFVRVFYAVIHTTFQKGSNFIYLQCLFIICQSRRFL